MFSRTLPESDIGRLSAAKGEAVRIDPHTAEILLKALGYCAASDGTFDITVGPLVSLWDFKNGVVADENALKEATSHVDFHKLSVWAQCGGNWFARLSDPKAQVDLGGIAKGWIADSVGQQLMDKRFGLSGALINLGGNVLVRGVKPNGKPWRIGIRDPKFSALAEGLHMLTTIELDNESLVTSGTYERCFERNGIRYHHILDPKTGYPVDTPWEEVSVLARRSIDAEGFSTTFLALGLESSREIAKSRPEIIQAYFVDAEEISAYFGNRLPCSFVRPSIRP